MIRKIAFIILILFASSTSLFSEDRGFDRKIKELGGEYAACGKQYAVFIAINRYKNWLSLRNPVKDAREIKDILTRRYYIDEVIELYDEHATKAGIIMLFKRLIDTTRPEDSVFIFYAGHGYLDELSDTGFWIPTDGGEDIYTQENWLTNMQVRGFIRKMKARHVSLISDSCFSGDILNPSRGKIPDITDDYFKKAYSRVSRQVLTSGASETVPDVSDFAHQLKLALEGNQKPYLDPLMIYNEVRLGVKGTTPLLGNLKASGHQEGASFILFLKESIDIEEEPETALAEEQKPKISIEKAYGAIQVETKTAGDLYIDGTFQGKLFPGSIARVINLEEDHHIVMIKY